MQHKSLAGDFGHAVFIHQEKNTEDHIVVRTEFSQDMCGWLEYIVFNTIDIFL